MTKRACLAVVFAGFLGLSLISANPRAQARLGINGPEQVDLDAVARIKAEGLQRSQVMDLVWALTDLHGPRLTNSPQIRAAAKWATDTLAGWGLSNVALETWGPFGRGWVNEQFAAQVVAPTVSPLIAYPRPWTPGTDGVITAEVVQATVNSEQDFAKLRGTLRGKIVLVLPAVDIRPQTDPVTTRLSDKALTDLDVDPVRAARGRGNGPAGPTVDPNFRVTRMQFYRAEGALVALLPGSGGINRGSVFTGGFEELRDPKAGPVVPQVHVAAEQYNRLVRLVERKVPVRVSIDMRNRYVDDTLDSFNVIAELPGTDKADELVMLGAHFDSENAGTGATDNAAGVAATMEAMRILKASGVRLRRTVRLGLWTGEEQGLLGSEAYVTAHFAERRSMQLRPAHQKLSAYFNMDNGAGAIRGVYLQGNDAVRPIFSAWMEPLRSLGMTTLAIRSVGGTDHQSFDRVGLPGFQFIQDELEYDAVTHHSNMDVFDGVPPGDMMKNATIIATFVYQAATRDDRLPRKPLPVPTPRRPQ